ncbi:MAG: acetolactate synthase large subunit [Gammaproteobacteria bacterium]
MNGAEALLKTLIDSGIEVCFANPGTSEMHLVSAIGRTESMRPILCLFEGVVTGAADGYARMSDKAAITLLHLGPGLANGMANLHNAKKAHVPLINIVGDHAPYHLKFDAPLTSDVIAHAEINSAWVKVATSADDLSVCGAEAVAAAYQGDGKIATLIAPANFAWEKANGSSEAITRRPASTATEGALQHAAKLLSNGKKTAFVLGGRAMRDEATTIVAAIAEQAGAALFCETFPTRMERGAGRVNVPRIPYLAEHAVGVLGEFEQFIIVCSQTPAAFFAYPDLPSLLVPESAEVHIAIERDQNVVEGLQRLAEFCGVKTLQPTRQVRRSVELPRGELTVAAIGDAMSELMPENSIISDEGITAGAEVFQRTAAAPSHDWLAITGGAIGQGLPLSLGASVACPDRKTIALQADGSGMYTLQALWSMARENTDVTVVLLNNDSYAILNFELMRLKTEVPNDKTLSMLDLGRPSLNWQEIATGMGVKASRAATAEEFCAQFSAAMATKGPCLIEALMSPPTD